MADDDDATALLATLREQRLDAAALRSRCAQVRAVPEQARVDAERIRRDAARLRELLAQRRLQAHRDWLAKEGADERDPVAGERAAAADERDRAADAGRAGLR